MGVVTVATAQPIVVDVASGPAESYAGLRTALRVLQDNGAGFSDLPSTYPAEWHELLPESAVPVAPLREVALAPSERRLHRESEQVYRALAVGAAALCSGATEIGRPVELLGLGYTDLTSLRGFMRSVEFARMVPDVRIAAGDPGPVYGLRDPQTDFRPDRARCLQRMGVEVDFEKLSREPTQVSGSTETPEGYLYSVATDPQTTAAWRLGATIGYCRAAFFSSNWDGMATVAMEALNLLGGLPDSAISEVLKSAESTDGREEAIEFEPGILRSTADLYAFLAKVIGIQATFRGDHDSALVWFERMRSQPTDAVPSAELIAQSHLYTALTLTKRGNRLAEAAAQVEQGFVAVAPGAGEAASVRRERGWLHNLRGLTLFAERRHRSALDHEKLALECLDGLEDPSSVHLRINLYSNVSVLQEHSNRPDLALRTWERFSGAAGAQNPSFRKHHSYRTAGLLLRTGEPDRALREIETVLECARTGADDFHEYEVRAELGGWHLRRGDRDAADQQFSLAEASARRFGDPFRVAQAMAGKHAIKPSGRSADEIIEIAGNSITRRREAAQLSSVVAAQESILEQLPKPKTKLNRPFDLVNFQD